MELFIRTATTALVVALVLFSARRFGHRAAGLLAGLPFTTVPALEWTAVDQGADMASRAAVGSVFGCMLVPVFAIAYDRAARRWSPARSLVAGLAAIGSGVAVASAMPVSLWAAVVSCVAGVIVALRCLKMPESHERPRGNTPASVSSIVYSAILAGTLATFFSLAARGSSPHLAGLIAGLPTLGLVAVVRQHRGLGCKSVTPFLRGYVISTLGKALFGVVFASSAMTLGSTPAMLGAILSALIFCIAVDASTSPVPRRIGQLSVRWYRSPM